MIFRCRPGILTAAAFVLIAAALTRAQSQTQGQPPLTFGTGIEVINLTVTVTDAQGRLVPGLERDAFSVFEDGVKQELALFNKDRLPLSVVLLMDSSASMEDKVTPARAAAKRFVSTLVPEDRARVVAFNNRIDVLQDFTNDKTKLNDGIDRLLPSGATALHNAFYISIKDLQKEKQQGAGARRQAIILLSDGENTASIVTDEQVIDLARKAEISIYSIRLTTWKGLSEDQRACIGEAGAVPGWVKHQHFLAVHEKSAAVRSRAVTTSRQHGGRYHLAGRGRSR